MPTYSINVGSPTEATRLSDINSVLNEIPDNTSKLVSPRDLRDAVFTAWETISIKTTTNPSTSYNYMGIDYTNGNDSSTQQKLLLGRGKVAGSYILNNTLLNPSNTSNPDIYFYNTKSDSNLSQQDLTIGFLAGTNSLIYPQAPYINVQVISGSSSYFDFNLTNPSIGGNINLLSDYGVISLNGIDFPSVADSSILGPTFAGYVLKYNGYGKLIWDAVTFNSSSIISTGPVTIQGNPVTVNGFPLELTDATPVIQQIGGITAGTTFSNAPLVEVLRRIIYPYLPPNCTLQVVPNLIEHGSNPGVTLYWDIQKYSNNVTYANLPNSSFVPTYPYTITTAGTAIATYFINTSQTWTFTVDDVLSGGSHSGTSSATATLTAIYPYFYGLNANPALSGVTLYNNLIKLIQAQQNSVINLGGNGYVYFAYPASYPNLTQILDNNGYDVTTAFTHSTVSVNSSGLASNWSSISYKVYRSNSLTSLLGVNYTFNY